MNLGKNLYRDKISTEKIISSLIIKTDRKLLKIFLLTQFQNFFCELFHLNSDNSMEYYLMDNKIIQSLIQEIVETGEYTLEGIAYYTHIPFDVIYEAVCGIRNQLSLIAWSRVIALYIQIKPETIDILIAKLLELIRKNHPALFALLNET